SPRPKPSGGRTSMSSLRTWPGVASDTRPLQCGGAAVRAPPPPPALLDHLALGVVALGLGHFLEALALAGVHTLAGIVGGLAGRLAFAGIHSCALHLARVRGARRRDRGGREPHRSSGGKGNTGPLTWAHSGSP